MWKITLAERERSRSEFDFDTQRVGDASLMLWVKSIVTIQGILKAKLRITMCDFVDAWGKIFNAKGLS